MPTRSTTGIQPFLWYEKEAEAAARFYVSIFPDSRIDRVTAMPAESPSGPAGSVKVVEFTLRGQPYMAMTAALRPDSFNMAISLFVACADQAELDRYWNALSAGGEIQQCGWLKDKYGVSWQLVPAPMLEWMADPDRAKAKRVAEAMMEMVKLDFAALKRAYDGK